MGLQEVALCPHCQTVQPLVLVRSMTQYAPVIPTALERLLLEGEVVGEIPDPNPDLLLCDGCKDEYVRHWTEMWDDYYWSTI